MAHNSHKRQLQEHLPTPDFRVLTNNLILSTIFTSLDVTSMKNVRLVCKTWFHEATIVLGFEAKFDVLKMFDDPTTANIIPKVEPKLVKNVAMDFTQNMPLLTDALLKFIPFLTLYHNNVKTLTYKYHPFGEISPLFTILQILEFPALESVMMRFEFYIGWLVFFERPKLPTTVYAFPTRRRLLTIEISCSGDKSCVGDYNFKSSVENLVSSAPNLNKLFIENYNCYPELSQSHKIEKCLIRAFINEEKFDIEKLNAMLDQMKSTLRNLDLYVEDGQRIYTKISALCFPSMPKLSTLRILGILSPWILIRASRFPKLKSLVIISHDEVEMEKFVLSLGYVMNTTVESFSMTNYRPSINDPLNGLKLFGNVKSLFPNVNKIIWENLLFLTREFRATYSIYVMDYFEGLLNICRKFNFPKLHIIVIKKSPFSVDFVLKCLNLQKDPSVQWRYEENADEYGLEPIQNIAEKFMSILLLTRAMKSVVIENMFLGLKEDEEIWGKICRFVNENELPVQFR